MVQNGWLGQKTKQGFYKKIDKGIIHSIDLDSLEYTPQETIFPVAMSKAKSDENIVSRNYTPKAITWLGQAKRIKHNSAHT